MPRRDDRYLGEHILIVEVSSRLDMSVDAMKPATTVGDKSFKQIFIGK